MSENEEWFKRAKLQDAAMSMSEVRFFAELRARLDLKGKCVHCGQPPDLCVCDGTRTGARLDNSGGHHE